MIVQVGLNIITNNITIKETGVVKDLTLDLKTEGNS